MNFFYPNSRNTMLREILNDELNYECFDCHRAYKTPEYVSLNNAIFLCEDCAEIHRELPEYISVIVPNRLRNFSNEQLKLFYYGGNRKLLEFITYEYPKLKYLDPDIMYKTEAMEYYRKCIRANAFDLDYPKKPNPKEAYRYNKKVVKKEEQEEKGFIDKIQDYIDDEEEQSKTQRINRMGSKGKESPWDNYSNKDFFKLLNKTFGGNFFGDDEEEEDKFNKTYSNYPKTERVKKPERKVEKKESENTEMKKEENIPKEEKKNEDEEMKEETKETNYPFFKRQSTDLINIPKEEKSESEDSFMGESYYKKDNNEEKNDKMDIEKEVKIEEPKNEEINNKKEEVKIEENKKEDVKIEENQKEDVKIEENKKEEKKPEVLKSKKTIEKLGSKSEIIFHNKPNINQLGSMDMYPDAEEVFFM